MNYGLSKATIRKRWASMRRRVSPSNEGERHLYYDKGIRICPEWDDFLNFYNWAMESGFRNDLVLDRRDGNKNYCPENCRWVTVSVNNANKSQPKKRIVKSADLLAVNKNNHEYVYAHRGEFIRRSNGRFVAEMVKDGMCYHIGEFDSKELAIVSFAGL